MKTTLSLTISALGLAVLSVSTAKVQAQFSYTTNDGTFALQWANQDGAEVRMLSPPSFTRDRDRAGAEAGGRGAERERLGRHRL